MEMDGPICSGCTEQKTDIVVMPGENPDVVVEYLCAQCFMKVEVQNYLALPYAYVAGEGMGRPKGKLTEFEARANELIVRLFHEQEQIKLDVEHVRKRYENLFASLLEKLKELQTMVMTRINDSEAIEIEHINAFIADLRTAQTSKSLQRGTAYLATHFNSEEPLPRLPFILIPDRFEEVLKVVTDFPEPIINLSSYEVQQESKLLHRNTTIRPARRLIEDEMIVMPIDTLNMLIIDFSIPVPVRKMVPCSHFPYRVHARWCKVEENLYIYTGGLYKGGPVNWSDFINTTEISAERPLVSTSKGKHMCFPRHRHAVISHEHVVYAIGGAWVKEGQEAQLSHIEIMRCVGDWNASTWHSLEVDMPELFDPTVTLLKSVIFIAGKNRNIYKFDTVSQSFGSVSIFRTIDLQVNETQGVKQQEGTPASSDGRFPLPRQSSNSLILSWEAQISVLQHNHIYNFSPSTERVELKKKRISTVKSWCAPFPVIIKGSKGYFMLEATETDLTPAEDVWCFDFIKNDVSLVFEKPPAK